MVVRWHAALVAGDPVAAYGLLAPEARSGFDAEEFVALYASHRDALVAEAERLLAITRAQPPSEAAWVDVAGRRFELLRTRDGWRVTTPRGREPDDR